MTPEEIDAWRVGLFDLVALIGFLVAFAAGVVTVKAVA